jgi:hypothetical protein
MMNYETTLKQAEVNLREWLKTSSPSVDGTIVEAFLDEHEKSVYFTYSFHNMPSDEDFYYFIKVENSNVTLLPFSSEVPDSSRDVTHLISR